MRKKRWSSRYVCACACVWACVSRRRLVRAWAAQKAAPLAFDVETLVALGRSKGACPYFAARELKATATIVFCPYNYLVRPRLRV